MFNILIDDNSKKFENSRNRIKKYVIFVTSKN